MTRRQSANAKYAALRKRNLLHVRADKVSDPLFVGNAFFDPRDALQVKYEMLRRVRVDGQPIAQVARAFGFSRPTIYQARAAFGRAGVAGLLPDKRGPRRAHKLSAPVVQFARAALGAEPTLSPTDVAGRIRERFGVSVHPRSIERALGRSEKKTP